MSEAETRSATASSGELPDHRVAPSRVPEVALPSLQALRQLDLTQLIGSPRFLDACQHYGIGDVNTLLPAGASSQKVDEGGVEASLYARREKRRLIDLHAVMQERQALIDANARAKAMSALHAAAEAKGVALKTPTKSLESVSRESNNYVENEKRKAKSDLMAIVEHETKKAVREQNERVRQKEEQAAEARQLVEGDLRRRASNREFRQRVRERIDRKIELEAAEAAERRYKLEAQFATHEARLTARKGLAAETFRRRSAIESLQSREREDIRAALLEQMEENVRAKHLARHGDAMGSTTSSRGISPMRPRRRGQEIPELASSASAPALTTRARGGSATARNPNGRVQNGWSGKVLNVMEGPGGAKLLRVQQQHAEEQEAKIRDFEEKHRYDSVRREVTEQTRMLATSLRRESKEQRTAAQRQQLSMVHEGEEAFRSSVMSRLQQADRHVEARNARIEQRIRDRRALTIARDSEKREMAQRASRARDFAHKLLSEKEKSMNGRAAALREQRLTLASAGRRRAEQTHYAREALKDSLQLSPTPSLVTLRKLEPGLLRSLGVDVGELEQASVALSASLSEPRSRPASRPVSAPIGAGRNHHVDASRVARPMLA